MLSKQLVAPVILIDVTQKAITLRLMSPGTQAPKTMDHLTVRIFNL